MMQVFALAAILIGCGTFGCLRKVLDGRARKVSAGDRLTASEIGGALGEAATLLQFSSAFCAPCRTTRVVLSKTAETVPGVSHVEIDAEENLDLVRRFDIRRTPTTLLLDANGEIRNRVVGVPQQEQLLNALVAVSGK